ncbi:protein Star-like [Penaeus japonicus]|uniref:protein Star-like n=1 Tax=Penaeus japonicus TaxID=27405 RepID=UPI001C70B530|nr:protein Star-like [Penaeus japonicus]
MEKYRRRFRRLSSHPLKALSPLLAMALLALGVSYRDASRTVREVPLPPESTTIASVILEDSNYRDFEGFADDDPELISYIQQRKLHPPASRDSYNLINPLKTDYSRYKQSTKIDKILKNITNGFFVDVTAGDGEYQSRSLFFEQQRNWTGLLIEPDPASFVELQAKNRTAFSLNACLSLVPKCTNLTFAIQNKTYPRSAKKYMRIQCFPFYSLLLALNRTEIDLLSLSVGGDELKVLQTIPWTKIRIRLLEVQIDRTTEGEEAVEEFMAKVGYTYLGRCWIDRIFVRTELLDTVQRILRY